MPDRAEPTEKQRQWLWEQCGFQDKYLNSCGEVDYWLADPSGHKVKDYPPIDPNNLFKYAQEPAKLESVHFSWGDNGVLCWLYTKKIVGKPFYGEGLTEEDALFWAIYEALGG